MEGRLPNGQVSDGTGFSRKVEMPVGFTIEVERENPENSKEGSRLSDNSTKVVCLVKTGDLAIVQSPEGNVTVSLRDNKLVIRLTPIKKG